MKDEAVNVLKYASPKASAKFYMPVKTVIFYLLLYSMPNIIIIQSRKPTSTPKSFITYIIVYYSLGLSYFISHNSSITYPFSVTLPQGDHQRCCLLNLWNYTHIYIEPTKKKEVE